MSDLDQLTPAAALAAAIEEAAALLARSRHAIAMTGAGISRESGIPTFRGEDGLWTKHGEPPLNQFETFIANPAEWWARRLVQDATPNEFAAAIADARPNPGHRALAGLEQLGVLHHVITQNVDDLHRRAGQRSITEIHGNLYWMRCMDCHARWPRAEFPVDPASLPPRCTTPGCRGVVKGDGVMFGEPIPPQALLRSDEETRACDLFLVIGTSAVVFPAAQYPLLAARRGVPLIEINPEETPLTNAAALVLRGAAGEVLPRLLAAEGLRTGGGPGA